LLLGQALAGFERAAQNQVAQLYQNGLLQAHAHNCTLNKNFGIPFTNLGYSHEGRPE
jgi:hypothetical protein